MTYQRNETPEPLARTRTTGKDLGLLPCPFCGKRHDGDLIDTLYPNGTFWRQEEWGRSYHSRKQRQSDDRRCMTMHCTECNGGCGAEISADSWEEVVAKWNRRAVAAIPDEVHAALRAEGLTLARTEHGMRVIKAVTGIAA